MINLLLLDIYGGRFNLPTSSVVCGYTNFLWHLIVVVWQSGSIVKFSVACTINIAMIVNYAARGVIYDCSAYQYYKKTALEFTLPGSILR